MSCTAADSTALTTNSAAFQTCIAESLGSSIFPTGQAVVLCMESIEISGNCATCWGNLFGDFKTCFVDTCDFASDTPLDAELPQECADCLIEFGSKHSTTEDICGIAMADLPEGAADSLNAEIQKWAGSTKSTANPSARSIGTGVVFFALLMMAI